MITFSEYVDKVAVMLDRPDLAVDCEAIRNRRLFELELDSLDVVLLGSVSVDLLPRQVELPTEITDSPGDSTLGELYHFIAATLESASD